MGHGNTARNLAEFAKNPTGFSGLLLYYTDIEPCDLKVLVKEFIKYQNLKKIWFVANGSWPIEFKYLECLTNILKVNAIDLLRITSNNMEYDGSRLLASSYHHLTSLNLGGSNLEDADLKSVIGGINNQQKLKKLDLSNNNITYGVTYLASILKQLSWLSLNNNKIGDFGANFLAGTLEYDISLKTLLLDYNDIKDQGIVALSNLLIKGSFLKHLSIGHNEIGATAIESLSNALKVNKCLINLGMIGNKIGDSGCIKIAEGLKSNCSLKEIVLLGNNISPPGLQELYNMLKVNATITGIFFDSHEHFDKALLKRVSDKLEYNKKIQIDEGLYCTEYTIDSMGEESMEIFS